jgi:hypothetical protein
MGRKVARGERAVANSRRKKYGVRGKPENIAQAGQRQHAMQAMQAMSRHAMCKHAMGGAFPSLPPVLPQGWYGPLWQKTLYLQHIGSKSTRTHLPHWSHSLSVR